MSMKERWWQFHQSNPGVYEAFESYAFEAIRAGKTKLSHWLIINRMRWDNELKTDGEEFKLPNEFIAYYARLFMFYNENYRGFFDIKQLRGEPTHVYKKLSGKRGNENRADQAV